MKKSMIAALVLAALTFGTVQAQDDKAKKKADVAAAQSEVDANKADMKAMHDKKNIDKVVGDKEAIKQDNKDLAKGQAKLTKSQAKKGAKQVKAKF